MLQRCKQKTNRYAGISQWCRRLPLRASRFRPAFGTMMQGAHYFRVAGCGVLYLVLQGSLANSYWILLIFDTERTRRLLFTLHRHSNVGLTTINSRLATWARSVDWFCMNKKICIQECLYASRLTTHATRLYRYSLYLKPQEKFGIRIIYL